MVQGSPFGMFLHWGLYCIQARGEYMFGNPDYKPGAI